MFAFRVSRNGKVLCTIGHAKAESLHVSLSRSGKAPEALLFAHAFLAPTDELRIWQQWLRKPKPLKLGENISVELVDARPDRGFPARHSGRKVTKRGVELYCSWCMKSEKEVKKLIAGPKVYICNECVALCNEILNDKTAP